MSELSEDQMREMLANFRPPQVPSGSSERASSESAGPAKVVGCGDIVGGGLSSACLWKLVGEWEDIAQQVGGGLFADGFLWCAKELRRRLEAANLRQPEPNTQDVPRRLRPTKTNLTHEHP